MKRFAFRLENVLHYREEVEQQRQLTLARATEALEARRQEVRRLQKQVDEATEEMRRLGVRKLDLAALRQQQMHLGSLRGMLGGMERRLREAEAEWERVRGEYVEARKERRALELLRTQRASAHAHEAGVEEQKEMDEVGALRARTAE